MSLASQFYISTLLIYLGIDVMACWGLNLQFGVAGLVNFAYIVFQAAGAYTAAVLTLGPSSGNGGFQQYIGGSRWPFPLPILAAGLVGGLLSLAFGAIALRRLRSDYQAMVMLVVSLIATSVANNEVGLVNGPNGLSIVPKPLASLLNLSPSGYQWFFVALTAISCVLVYWFVHRLTGSPLGRALRSVRENEFAAAALGKNVAGLRLLAFVSGGVIAGISGALLVEFISAWSPGSWLFPETFVFFAALIVGGVGNNFGALLGALLVPIAFLEATRFIPQFGYPGLVDALQWVVVGSLTLVFLWFWPRGVVPERKRRFPTRPAEASNAPPALIEPRPDKGPESQASQAVVLEVRDLHRDFGGVKAVDGATFEVPEGRITGLIGPNGAGKSTVVTMIAGALRPSGGSILFRGADVTGEPSYRMARRGVIRTFQIPSEFSRLTVMENLLVASQNHPGEKLRAALLGKRAWTLHESRLLDRATGLLDRFDMDHMQDEYAGNLSGGQKRLLEMMRALMTQPDLLLLDEPMSGVNPTLARRIEQILLDLRDEGLTILMVEHELQVVERLCDPVVVMARGRVIATGTMEQIRSDQRVLDAYLVG
ncbi:MAG: branched-chain amino acid ABC transporter ATP-binding protein/permease [Actinomycetota bacterium]|nr:branched-chain amino acid ABC transporter ATP-binding protein/permease [Actinomycetota bacterium]